MCSSDYWVTLAGGISWVYGGVARVEFFFFQAEDGIRDVAVTGVQTCALPILSTACCGPNNRGVAVSGGSVFVGTLDDYLVALDATTGKVKWEAKVGDGPEAGYTETMAPLVIGDNVIIGTAGAEYGIRGYVKSFNATTRAPGGEWYTLPSPEDGGWWGPFSKTTPDGDDLKRDIAKEKADSAKYADAWKTGGGSMWMTP